MVGGLSGYLCQEFRELEILDKITKLRFHEKLSDKVVGITRSQQISSYRKHEGEHYVPSTMPSSLQWSIINLYRIEKLQDEYSWEIIQEKKIRINTAQDKHDALVDKSNYVAAKGTTTLPSTSTDIGIRLPKKRKQNPEIHNENIHLRKKNQASFYLTC